MARLEIRFDMPSGQQFARIFDHLSHVPEDFREPFEQMADDWAENERETFSSEGPAWKPLARSTQRDRARKGYPPSNPILERTGRLRASLTDLTGPDAIYEVYPQQLVLGSALRTPNGRWNLAAIHQYGATINRNGKTWRIPARPVMQLTQQLQRNWEKRMADWLRDEINYTG
jgi:phage gpG-like protein